MNAADILIFGGYYLISVGSNEKATSGFLKYSFKKAGYAFLDVFN